MMISLETWHGTSQLNWTDAYYHSLHKSAAKKVELCTANLMTQLTDGLRRVEEKWGTKRATNQTILSFNDFSWTHLLYHLYLFLLLNLFTLLVMVRQPGHKGPTYPDDDDDDDDYARKMSVFRKCVWRIGHGSQAWKNFDKSYCRIF